MADLLWRWKLGRASEIDDPILIVNTPLERQIVIHDALADLKNRAGTTGTAGEHFGRLGNILDQNPRFFVDFLSLSEITYF